MTKEGKRTKVHQFMGATPNPPFWTYFDSHQQCECLANVAEVSSKAEAIEVTNRCRLQLLYSGDWVLYRKRS
jgi:hypothetical protein